MGETSEFKDYLICNVFKRLNIDFTGILKIIQLFFI